MRALRSIRPEQPAIVDEQSDGDIDNNNDTDDPEAQEESANIQVVGGNTSTASDKRKEEFVCPVVAEVVHSLASSIADVVNSNTTICDERTMADVYKQKDHLTRLVFTVLAEPEFVARKTSDASMKLAVCY